MVALSAMSVFFTSLIGILLGLRAADPTSLDLVAAYGGGRWQQLRRVRLAAALPSTVAALKVAAPSALLGAIIGEYLGRVDNGLGLAMTVAQQQLDVARTWGIALVAGAIAGIGYGLIALVARFAVPWARTTTRRLVMTTSALPDRTLLTGGIVGSGVDATTGNGAHDGRPGGAGRTLSGLASASRSSCCSRSGWASSKPLPSTRSWPRARSTSCATSSPARTSARTGRTSAPACSRPAVDAGVGFVVGLAVAFVVAVLFVLSQTIEAAFLPIAMVIRSVPLVAMTPVITLVFGRGLLGTTVVSGIVVFFPSLVIMVFGLRSAPRQAADLCRAYGGSPFMTLRKVAVPSALPSIFASARIAVPGALIGALLAEWLATGKGLGAQMLDRRLDLRLRRPVGLGRRHHRGVRAHLRRGRSARDRRAQQVRPSALAALSHGGLILSPVEQPRPVSVVTWQHGRPHRKTGPEQGAHQPGRLRLRDTEVDGQGSKDGEDR